MGGKKVCSFVTTDGVDAITGLRDAENFEEELKL